MDEIENLVVEQQLVPESCGVEYVPIPSPLEKWWALRSGEPRHCPSLTPTGKSYFKGFFSPCIKAVWDEDFDVLVIILNFHLVGRCQLRWKEDLGNRSPWVFGSHPTMSVPEKRVHDNELAVENTSASRQGKHLSCWKRIFKCL